MALDSRHHAFLQMLLSRGPQPATAAKLVFKELFTVQNDKLEEEFFRFLGAYNKQLDFLQLEIRGSMNQYDGTQYYGVINKQGNDQSKLGTRYNYAQIAYFKALVEALVQEQTGELSSIRALNLHVEHYKDQEAASSSQAPQVTSGSDLSLGHRESALYDMADDKWLGRTDDGNIILGIKAFLELRSMFKNLDVPFCDICNEAGIKALHCSNPECPARLHSYCAVAKFSMPEVPRICPSCGRDWDCSSLNLSQHVSKASRASSSSVPSTKKRRLSKRTRD